jgi:putative flavoprotein involved in K+ transport
MTEQKDTIVIGGGQAGLAISYYLTQQSRNHVVLEQAAQVGNRWRNHCWDSFTWVTPNWTIRLPGAEYQGNNPDGFFTRAEIVAYFEQYAERFNLPVRYGIRAIAVEPKMEDGGYLIKTDGATFESANVVIATGLGQQPRLPSFAAQLPAEIKQLHSSEYRNPAALPPGAVLVVGSAQSGCQITEELYQSGRKVYLCVGSAVRLPRRYRSKDIFWWMNQFGLSKLKIRLPSPKTKLPAPPHLSGKDGGHSLNLHQFARDGVMLLGHLQSVQGDKIILAPDLKKNLAKADRPEAMFTKLIDLYAMITGMKLPKESLPQLRDGYEMKEILELDLKSAGINTVIWATGYQFDFSWVKVPILDSDGRPIHKRGITKSAGLYFLGLPWRVKSIILLGVGDEAAYVASEIASRTRQRLEAAK